MVQGPADKVLCLVKNSTEVSWVHESLCDKLLMFPFGLSLTCNEKCKIKNVSGKPLNCIFHAMAKLVFWSPSNYYYSGRELCADAGKQSSHQFLGCWSFLSNLLTSPIHNIFTFFKICIGRVLKTTKGLLIMDNGPRCSVRCLLNSWQQCLGIIGLSFLFFFFFFFPQST